jgi:hypothetical protein
MYQIANTAAIRQKKPPAAPPAMGAMAIEDFDP